MDFYNRKLLIIDDDVTVATEQLRSRPQHPPPTHRQPNASSPLPHVLPRPGTTPFDSSMALTVLVLLAALFFMGFFSIYIRRFADDSSVALSRRRHRRRRISAHPSRPAKGNGPDASSAVRSLPMLRYCGPAEEEPIECAVCLGEFEEGDTIKVIPACRHLFHPPCIDTWLALHLSCPLCRTTKLFPAKAAAGGGSEGLGSGVAVHSDPSVDVGELREESTAEVAGVRSEEEHEVGPIGVTRTSSGSGMGEPASTQLRRTASF